MSFFFLIQKKNLYISAKKERVIFRQVPISSASDEDQEFDLGSITNMNNNSSPGNSKKHKDLESVEIDQPLRLLQAHGLAMMMDNDTIVENAMESGQTVVLTGKLNSPNFFFLQYFKVANFLFLFPSNKKLKLNKLFCSKVANK